MDTKSLLIGLGGFMLGGLVVSIAASQALTAKPAATPTPPPAAMTMMQMNDDLTGKTGDTFDKAFLAGMIVHHEGAVAMAKQAKAQAKHQEIKAMADNIIAAQTAEIAQMRAWQTAWGYPITSDEDHMREPMMGH